MTSPQATRRPQNVPTITVQLDRPRTLAFTLGAMRRIREETGQQLSEIAVAGDSLVDRISVYIWAMLVTEDREGLTVQDIEEMLHPGNIPEMTRAFVELATGGRKAEESSGTDEGKAPRKTARKRN